MNTLKSLNLAFAFVLELCLLAAFGYWGWQTGGTLLTQIALGIGAPLLVAIVWGIFAAPASRRRLKQPWLALLKIVLFGAGAFALFVVGQTALAVLLILLFAVNLVLAWVWRQA